MKLLIALTILSLLFVACASSSKKKALPQSNADAEKKSEQLNNSDIVPDSAADSLQNQNNQNPKLISF